MRIPVILLWALTISHTVSTITIAAASVGTGQEEPASTFAVRALLTLDAAIQMRFEQVNDRFGYARVVRPGAVHGFAPENDAELSSLLDLEDANLRVVLYIGGRRVLGREPDERRAHWPDLIKGPAWITRGPRVATPPAESLSMEARRAFATFERQQPQHEFEVQRWNVLARPVRAVNDTCLKCHRSTGRPWPWSGPSDMRVGDVIGVVFYAYQEAGSARTTASHF